MSELELCDTLGILLEPEQNRLKLRNEDQLDDIQFLTCVLSEINQQKKEFGTLNPDIWLELIPWHSLN